MPSGTRVKAETVARGCRRADAPARCRRACVQRLRRPQQQERQAGIAGGEMQFLAGLQIESVDHAGDGGRRRRTQRLGHRPQRFFAVRGLDHNHAGRIETESTKPMAAKLAISAPSVSRDDDDDRMQPRQAGEKRCDETEGRRLCGFGRGYDFMQGTGGQAAFRQIGIECVEAEGQSAARAFADGKKLAQFMDHGSARRRHGKIRWFKHLNRLSPWIKHLCPLYIPRSYTIEQNENIAKRDLMGRSLRGAKRRKQSSSLCRWIASLPLAMMRGSSRCFSRLDA